jgi:hypothetical protein
MTSARAVSRSSPPALFDCVLVEGVVNAWLILVRLTD